MVYYIMVSVEYAPFPSDKSCSSFVIATQAVGILQNVPGAAFSALRAYVLSRSKPLGLFVAALSLAPLAANLVLYGYQYSGVNFAPFGCFTTYNATEALVLRFDPFIVIVSRVPLIAADIILIYITWTKLRGAALTDLRQPKRLTLSDVLFRGGTILFILNVLHLGLSAAEEASGDSDGSLSLITQFTTPITAILISRFLLELQQTNHVVVKLDADDPLHSSRNAWDSTPSFISSIGGFINPARSARSDDDGVMVLQDRVFSGVPGEEEGEVPAEVPYTTASACSTA
ncbi:hypothetical protein K466DRAFT_589102 [Polyporus arcularius HHB13444]|uniref:Uncharacterized protein n=1 Tax=Polyporus arcularius HHB13444 TaxID=1314778 RepID=A0A5C3P5E8_9APHY|nr:hypothetical protein K466DRAFT_589102 [Polyporus arcularius HHB13444]